MTCVPACSRNQHELPVLSFLEQQPSFDGRAQRLTYPGFPSLIGVKDSAHPLGCEIHFQTAIAKILLAFAPPPSPHFQHLIELLVFVPILCDAPNLVSCSCASFAFLRSAGSLLYRRISIRSYERLHRLFRHRVSKRTK